MDATVHPNEHKPRAGAPHQEKEKLLRVAKINKCNRSRVCHRRGSFLFVHLLVMLACIGARDVEVAKRKSCKKRDVDVKCMCSSNVGV